MAGGLSPPASVVQGWPKPNYDNPPTRGNAILVVVGVLGPLATLAIVLRIWSRFKLQRNVGLDDWYFLAAVVLVFSTLATVLADYPLQPFALSYTIGACLVTKVFSCDRHIWDIPLQSVPTLRKAFFAQCVFYVFSTCLIKMSVLCFYRRLTDRSISAAFIYTVWICMFLETCQLAVCLGVLCMGCSPLSAYWNRFIPSWREIHKFSCVPEGSAILSMSIISVVQDLIATAMPFYLFLGMKITRRQKIALCFTFVWGLSVCAVGAYRAYIVHRTYYKTYDTTWSAYDFMLASLAEILLASIVASAPALKYYIRHTVDARRSTPRNSTVNPEELTGATESTIMSKSYFESEAGDLAFFDALTSTAEKDKARAAISYLSGWQGDMERWQHGRTPSAQEMELMKEGIIAPQHSVPFYNRDKRCMETNDPHPVRYEGW